MIEFLSVSLGITSAIYFLLVTYMYKGWKGVPFSRFEPYEERISVSVIIAVRDEEKNIERTIESLLQQNYPKFLTQIIIVDDHSTDRTAEIVKSYANQGIELIQLNEKEVFNSYKKLAIATAIQQAKGEVIVTTDGDCRMGELWLSTLMKNFHEKECYLLSSPVLYSEEKSFFERLQSLEFLYLIGLGAAGIRNNNPTTCNGANLAYRKKVFYEMQGFQGIDDLASGDDELFLHKVAENHADKIYFCKSREAVVYTDAKPTFSSFISQRRRWASKSTKYKNKKVVALGVLIWLFNLSFVCVLVSLFFASSPLLFKVFLFSLFSRLLIDFIFMRALTVFAKYERYLIYLPILVILHPFYLVGIGVFGNIGKYNWKGRRVK